MKENKAKYWICQFGGWLFYALTMLFFAYWFDKTVSPMFWKRIFLFISLGLIFTHLLRCSLHKFKLLPPLKGNMWLMFFVLVILTCVCYSLSSSVIIQWQGWFDKSLKGNIQKRFVYNLFVDSPIIFVWTSIYYIWHYVDNARKTEVDNVKLESLVKELELKTIKSHINPHFIFNALNSIRALVDENPSRARTAITELSNILRSSMQAEKLETVTLETELNIVRDYLALEQMRFEERLRVEMDIDEDTLDQTLPPMVLQTIVENAIKHGISKNINGGLVKIKIEFVDDHMEISVKNTGQVNGILQNGDGFGLRSINDRLKLLYQDKAAFEIKNYNAELVESKIILPIKLI